MTRVRVHNFTISLDGYGAGPRQTREDPLGVGGGGLHEWFIPTRAFQRINGKTGGTTGVDDDIAARFGVGVGAWIMGRNMFGPIRGPWPDDAWRGWWGKIRRTMGRCLMDARFARYLSGSFAAWLKALGVAPSTSHVWMINILSAAASSQAPMLVAAQKASASQG